MNKCEQYCQTIKRMANAGGDDGYTPVEYLQSSGTQYFNTGVYATPYTAVSMDMQCIATTAQTRLYEGTGGINFVSYISGSGKWSYSYGTNYVNSSVSADTDRHTIILDGYNQNFKNYEQTLSTFTRPQTSATNSIKLINNTFNGKLYGCQILDNNILIKNYIPCYRNIDNEPGLYDNVTGEFLTNMGSGSFTVGPVIPAVPNEYQRVHCLKSSGTQYIITPITARSTLSFEVSFARYASADNSSKTAVFGVNSTSNDRVYFCAIKHKDFNANVDIKCWQYGTSSALVKYTGDTSRGYTFCANPTQAYYVGYSAASCVPEPFTSSLQIRLFDILNKDQWTTRLFGEIYYFKIFENGELILNCVPCYRKSDNKPGMYDTVSDTFLTNAGTGEFTVGADV